MIDELVKYIYLVLTELEGNNIILGNNIKPRNSSKFW